jgi:hypothetical protein
MYPSRCFHLSLQRIRHSPGTDMRWIFWAFWARRSKQNEYLHLLDVSNQLLRPRHLVDKQLSAEWASAFGQKGDPTNEDRS